MFQSFIFSLILAFLLFSFMTSCIHIFPLLIDRSSHMHTYLLHIFNLIKSHQISTNLNKSLQCLLQDFSYMEFLFLSTYFLISYWEVFSYPLKLLQFWSIFEMWYQTLILGLFDSLTPWLLDSLTLVTGTLGTALRHWGLGLWDSGCYSLSIYKSLKILSLPQI